MPRQSQKTRNIHPQWRDQDTFRYTTPAAKVVAKPVDAFVKPGMRKVIGGVPRPIPGHAQISQAPSPFRHNGGDINVDSSVADMRLWVGLLNTGASLIGPMIGAYTNSQEGKAVDDIAQGKPPKENASNAYIKKYEIMNGKADEAAFAQGLTEQYEAVRQENMTPEEIVQELNMFKADWMKDKSVHYARGLLPGAIGIEKAMHKRIFEDAKQDMHLAYQDQIRKIIRSDHQKISENPDFTTAEKNTLVHNMVSNLQDYYKGRLDRDEISRLALEIISPQAEELGKPEMMAWVDIPDKSGMSIRNTGWGAKIDQSVTNAKRQHEALADKEVATLIRERKKWKATVVSGVEFELEAIADGTSEMGSHAGLRAIVEANRPLLGGKYHVMMDKINDAAAGRTIRTDPEVATRVEDVLARGIQSEILSLNDEADYLYDARLLSWKDTLPIRRAAKVAGDGAMVSFKRVSTENIKLRLPGIAVASASGVSGPRSVVDRNSGKTKLDYTAQKMAIREFNEKVDVRYHEKGPMSKKAIQNIADEVIEKYTKMKIKPEPSTESQTTYETHMSGLVTSALSTGDWSSVTQAYNQKHGGSLNAGTVRQEIKAEVMRKRKAQAKVKTAETTGGVKATAVKGAKAVNKYIGRTLPEMYQAYLGKPTEKAVADLEKAVPGWWENVKTTIPEVLDDAAGDVKGVAKNYLDKFNNYLMKGQSVPIEGAYAKLSRNLAQKKQKPNSNPEEAVRKALQSVKDTWENGKPKVDNQKWDKAVQDVENAGIPESVLEVLIKSWMASGEPKDIGPVLGRLSRMLSITNK